MKHIINLREDGWVIMHPLSCRPNLFDCLFSTATLQEDRPKSFTGVGNYGVYLQDSTLFVGEKLDELPKTELDLLKEMQSTLSEADGSEYARGCFNGLEFAIAMLEDRSPMLLPEEIDKPFEDFSSIAVELPPVNFFDRHDLGVIAAHEESE